MAQMASGQGGRAVLVSESEVAQLRGVITQLVSDLSDSLRKQDLLAENCRVLEESGSMAELRMAKEEVLMLQKHVHALQLEQQAEQARHAQEMNELRGITKHTLEDAEIGKSNALQEAEGVWRKHLSVMQSDMVLLKESERVANDENKALRLSVDIMATQLQAAGTEKEKALEALQTEKGAHSSLRSQVRERHEEMVQMLKEQELQIATLKSERDEIELILSGLKDIVRLEQSRERARADAARAINEAKAHMGREHKAKEQSVALSEAVQQLRREFASLQEKCDAQSAMAQEEAAEALSERLGLLKGLEDATVEVAGLKRVLKENGISVQVRYSGADDGRPSFTAHYEGQSPVKQRQQTQGAVQQAQQ
eukprot:CAMPEP_0114143118 /NCGR_PEP_ID=MMETSP0043_2-20121206/18812_1 /TAXON_ID=464988 /ORGANISM="Hemiselmis andersenii, Strain CCMP644" /LENGTH=367 /DNA_ID=CAMNT_0001237387 /DNA_START=31 /DNA_END=1132 /DNA_ORIENTATION=-